MKTMKRLFPLFLALVMVLSSVVAVPLSVSAAGATNVTEPTGADESTVGYKAENVVKITAETIEAEGAATVTMTDYAAGNKKAKYVSINTADELVLFSDYSNSKADFFGGKVVYLTADINMAGKTMYPVAFRAQSAADYVNAVAFRGTFDGQGYTISNLNMTMTSLADVLAKVEARWGKNYTTWTGTVNGNEVTRTTTAVNGWGLFCYLDSDGTYTGNVKNLRMDSTCHFESVQNGAHSGTGSIVGTVKNANVRVTNCYSAATVIDCTTGSAGGFFGRGEAKIVASNLTFEGNVIASNHAGGIMGYNSGFEISNSLSAGVVTSKNIHAGGFAARLDATGVITNSVNESELIIDVDNDNVYMAGFVAKVRKGTNLTLTNVTNKSTNMHFAEGRGVRGRIYTDNFYNLALTGTAISYQPAEKQVTLNTTNCKGVELEVGYSADRIKKLSGGVEFTATTTAAEIQANSLFYISTPEGLVRLAQLVNDSSVNVSNGLVNGKTIYLTNDLDMSGIDWMPIGIRPNGTMAARAEGIRFDGQGYTISNLICAPTYAETASVGLFGAAYAGFITNVVLDASCAFIADGSFATQSTAAILGYNGGVTVSNCQTSAFVYGHKAGGITGGGPANSTAGGAYFCTNYGTIQGYTQAAGIHGGIDDGATALNCVNYGTISAFWAKGAGSIWAAGITNGNRGGHQIRNNINYGTVSCSNGGYCGMIVTNNNAGAKGYHLEIRNNTNYGILSQSANSSNVVSDPAVVVSTSTEGQKALLNGTGGTATVWGNKTVNSTHIGYNADKISQVPADVMAKIADVKDVWTIADGKATLNAGYTVAPNVLKVTDAAGMRVLSAVVYFGNNLKGHTIYLANDIDMTGMIYDATDLTFSKETTFLPIGHIDGSLWTGDNYAAINVDAGFGALTQEAAAVNYTKFFSGNFDGQGYAIKNWTVDNTSASTKIATRIGLFGVIHQGLVQNVVFDASNKMINATDMRSRMTGVVVQATMTLIDNVWNRCNWMNDIKAENAGRAGGIVAVASIANVTSCTNDGDVHGIRSVGGIVGWGYNSIGIANCRNNGAVSATFTNSNYPAWIPSMNIAGGILGLAGIHGSHTRIPRIVNCVNNGVITTCDSVTVAGEESDTTYAPWEGSIVGYASVSAQIRALNVVDYANADLNVCGQNKSFNAAANVFELYEVAETDEMLEAMLSTRYQARSVAGATQDIRLIGTVDVAENYLEAGFIITDKDGREAVVKTGTAYTSLIAAGAECTPENYGACTSQYFFAVTINDIPEAFTAQCYVVTMDGTTLYGNVINVPTPNVPMN